MYSGTRLPIEAVELAQLEKIDVLELPAWAMTKAQAPGKTSMKTMEIIRCGVVIGGSLPSKSNRNLSPRKDCRIGGGKM